MKAPPVLILGVGNILLSDEGVGVRVVQTLAAEDLPPNVEVADGATAGVDLLDLVADRWRLIVIDAVDADLPAGSVLRLNTAELVGAAADSLHDIGVLEVLRMAELLGCAPREVEIIGVVPGSLAVGVELSPEVGAALPRVVELVRRSVLPGGAHAA